MHENTMANRTAYINIRLLNKVLFIMCAMVLLRYVLNNSKLSEFDSEDGYWSRKIAEDKEEVTPANVKKCRKITTQCPHISSLVNQRKSPAVDYGEVTTETSEESPEEFCPELLTCNKVKKTPLIFTVGDPSKVEPMCENADQLSITVECKRGHWTKADGEPVNEIFCGSVGYPCPKALAEHMNAGRLPKWNE